MERLFTRTESFGARRALSCAGLAFLLLLALAALLAPVASADNPLTWTAPKQADVATPLSQSANSEGVSCDYQDHFCAAIDYGGIITSSDPEDGVWNERKEFAGFPDFQSISCASDSLCAATTSDGYVYAGDPTASPSTWGKQHVAVTASGLGKVTCAADGSSLCLVSDGDHVHASTDPGAAAPIWSDHQITNLPDEPAGTQGFSTTCTTLTFCVVIDAAGWVFYSNSPTGSSWTRAADLGRIVTSVTCPLTGYCIAVDFTGGASITSSPTSTTVWPEKDISATTDALYGVSCSFDKHCAAYSRDGFVFSTPYLSSSTGWSGAQSDGAQVSINQPTHINDRNIRGISCSDGPLCVAIDFEGNAIASTDPTGDATAWTATSVDGGNPINSIQCTSSTFCAAADSDGRVLTSSNPSGNVWGTPHAGTTTPPTQGRSVGFACSNAAACVLGDEAGKVFSSTTVATGSPPTWNALGTLGDEEFDVISCSPGDTLLCVGINDGDELVGPTGPVLTSSNYWSDLTPDDMDQPTSVSCVSALCVATDSDGEISTLSTAAPEFSDPVEIDSHYLYAVSCASTSLCAATDDSGNILVSTTPTNPASWTKTKVDGAHVLTAVSCRVSPDTLCAAVDDDGNVVTSTNPTGGAGAWTVTKIDDDRLMSAVECRSGNLCVAADFDGDILTATGSGSTTPSGPAPPGPTLPGPITLPGPTVPSAAAIKAALEGQLTPSGKTAKIKPFLKSGYSKLISALTGGSLNIGWYAVPRGAHLAKAKPVLIASGSASYSAAGSLTFKIKATSAGKKYLKKLKKAKLTARASFTPSGSSAVVVLKDFTLKA